MSMLDRIFRAIDVDFSAKLRWRMRFDRNPLFVTLQDKYAVKEYARVREVDSPKLLYATDRPETIPFDALPPSYMIKANHGSSWNVLCHNSELYRFRNGKELVMAGGEFLDAALAAKNRITREEAISLCTAWLGRRFVKREWAYQHIRPRIIVEELLAPADGEALKDYKFYVFDGVVKALYVGSPIYRRDDATAFFYPDWTEIRMTKSRFRPPEPMPQRPERLAELIDAAQRLAEGLDFARVDMYVTGRGVLLGEVTIYPHGGTLATLAPCKVFDRWLGSHWRLGRADAAVAYIWDLLLRGFFDREQGRCERRARRKKARARRRRNSP